MKNGENDIKSQAPKTQNIKNVNNCNIRKSHVEQTVKRPTVRRRTVRQLLIDWICYLNYGVWPDDKAAAAAASGDGERKATAVHKARARSVENRGSAKSTNYNRGRNSHARGSTRTIINSSRRRFRQLRCYQTEAQKRGRASGTCVLLARTTVSGPQNG